MLKGGFFIPVNRYTLIMTNVRKNGTTSSDYVSAHTQLITLIAQLNKRTAPYLISGLLTEAEQIMIIKRFAAAVMFRHSFSPYRVSRTLGMSISSSQRIYAQYEEGQFSDLLGCMKKKEMSTFLMVISDMIMAQVDMKARARLANHRYS
jgi:hypothetical protein